MYLYMNRSVFSKINFCASMSDQSFFLTADAVVETVVSETTDHQQTLTHEYRSRESSEIYRPKLVQYNDIALMSCHVLCMFNVFSVSIDLHVS